MHMSFSRRVCLHNKPVRCFFATTFLSPSTHKIDGKSAIRCLPKSWLLPAHSALRARPRSSYHYHPTCHPTTCTPLVNLSRSHSQPNPTFTCETPTAKPTNTLTGRLLAEVLLKGLRLVMHLCRKYVASIRLLPPLSTKPLPTKLRR